MILLTDIIGHYVSTVELPRHCNECRNQFRSIGHRVCPVCDSDDVAMDDDIKNDIDT